MFIKKIIKVIKNPKLAVFYIMRFRVFRIIPNKLYLKLKFRLIMGKKLNLENVTTFNEKMQWLKINDRKSEYTNLVDKYLVRKYIADTIGEEHLIPLLGVFENFEKIDFERLPNQFVLKPNHTSGDVFICKNKANVNYIKLKKEVNKWLKKNYFWAHREWPYKNIKPLVICEKYLIDESEIDIKDYKFMCFNGQVKCIFTCLNRDTENGLNINIYNDKWELMPFSRKGHPNSRRDVPRPKTFDEMIYYAEKLSASIPFLRVDFYEVKGKLYFGELTFYPVSGYGKLTPEFYDSILGDWLDLPI